MQRLYHRQQGPQFPLKNGPYVRLFDLSKQPLHVVRG